MPISYTTKVDQRPVGFENPIVNEVHIVGIIGTATTLSGQIKLIERPLQEDPSTVIIPGYTEITAGSPGATEFLVDYLTGYVTFDASQDSLTVMVTYKGRGSVIDAVDVNELQSPVGVALNFDGSLTNGIVTPLSISTNVLHDFSFPNDVSVAGDLSITGDLTVNGTTTTINSQTVLIEDNIITLNSNVVGAPILDSGLTINRGSSPDVQLLWKENIDAWTFRDSSDNSLLTALDTGNVGIGTDTPSERLEVTGNLKVTGEHKNCIVELLAVDPGTPAQGQIWFNTVDLQFKGYNGSSVVILG